MGFVSFEFNKCTHLNMEGLKLKYRGMHFCLNSENLVYILIESGIRHLISDSFCTIFAHMG